MDGLSNARCFPRHRALLQRASPRPPRRPPADGGPACWGWIGGRQRCGECCGKVTLSSVRGSASCCMP